MATQTKNGRKNGNRGPTPDVLGALVKKPGRPKKTRTAEQIADSIEAEVKRLQGVANILRGET